MKYDVISADSHIDLIWLPPDLFTDNAAAAMKDRMPYVTDGPRGKEWVTKNGASFGLMNGMGSGGRLYEPGQDPSLGPDGLGRNLRGRQEGHPPHDRSRTADQRPGPRRGSGRGVVRRPRRLDPDQRRRGRRRDAAHLQRMARRILQSPIPTALPGSPASRTTTSTPRSARSSGWRVAVACAASKSRGGTTWRGCGTRGGSRCGAPSRRAALPLHFHTIGGGNRPDLSKLAPKTALAARAAGHHQFPDGDVRRTAVDDLLGRLDRHPTLKVIIGEAGIGWIPYVLNRMDAEWEDQFKELDLKMRPSEYWRRQCYATYQTDPIGTKLVDDIGEDNIMWASDFPHPGRDLARLAGIHPARARSPARGDATQDRLRQRRQALPLRQLASEADFITVA